MENYTGLEIAVIGMSCRFPKADTIQQFWENLKKGRDCVSDFSEEELLAEGESATMLKDPAYVKANPYVENKKYFDAEFFNYLPDEAELMDPQIRLYHECCWEALEDSGYGSMELKEKAGLFSAGTPNINWELYAMHKNKESLVDDFTASHVRDITYLSTLVAYRLNLKGPAVFMQSACSSSLVTIQAACNSLLLGECSMALAGGITIRNYSKKGYLYVEGAIFSKDGRCRPFDAAGNGTVSSEGAGVVVLKRLSDALKSNDHIYAIIKGAAVNNDGSNKVGFTAPGVQGQSAVITRAFKIADIDPDTVGYMETHGTATALGDPIEIQSLNEAFTKLGAKKNKPVAIGSVKSNMGHLDSAAGVAGFIKTVLAIKNKQIPASLHYNKPNPHIDFAGGPFYVNNSLTDWDNKQGPLRAGVSSFGIGGTNAHVVLEEPPAVTALSAGKEYQLMVLSAKTKTSLDRYTAKFIDYLKNEDNIHLADIAYTLQTGRTRFAYRKMLVCEKKGEAIDILSSEQAQENEATHKQEELQNTIFMFPGQGAQYSNMCRDLYSTEKYFKEKVDECLAIARQYSSEDFYAVLFPEENAAQADPTVINNTHYAQPLLFIIEYALAQLFLKWGIKADYMIGHSIGEYVAACISGVFSINDALRLVIRRGELMSSVPAGSMLGIAVKEEDIQPLLAENKKIELAVINSPSSLVVAGETGDIAAFEQQVNGLGYTTKKIHTSHAFHSYMMDSILHRFEQEFSSVQINPPAIPYISNTTGKEAEYEEIKHPAYWSSHLRTTVQFLQGSETLLQKGTSLFIEMGPGRTMCNYISENSLATEKHRFINTVRHSKQVVNDLKYITEKLGQLWLQGARVNWNNYYAGEKRRKLSLPTYSFEQTAYTVHVDAVKLISREWGGNGLSTETVIHVPHWRPVEIPPVKSVPESKTLTYIVLGGHETFSGLLIEKILSKGQKVITVKPGNGCRQLTENEFEINYHHPGCFTELWNQFEQAGIMADTILYGAALSDQPVTTANNFEEKINIGYLALAAFGKTLATANKNGQVKLLVINNQVAKVVSADEVDPVKTTIQGPARMIATEIPEVKCRLIDIPYPFQQESDEKTYAELLLNESLYESTEQFVAYRYGERWVRAFSELPENEEIKSPVVIDKTKTYIITGGFGGIGFTIASDLAQRHGANIVLLHRSAFPERKDWNEWIATHETADATSKKILQIREMENTGSRVQLFQLDVTNETAVKEMAEQLTANGTTINGLLWAAGEIDNGGILINRSKESLLQNLSSKVNGLLLFEKYLPFNQLDCIALFSSIGNVLYQQQFGQVAYNAANEFLETYACYARKKGVRAVTINWCPWLEVGMAVQSMRKEIKATDTRLVNSKIKGGIYPGEGIHLFYKCMAGNVPVATIYKGDLNKAVQQLEQQHRKLKDQFNTAAETSARQNLDGSTAEEQLSGIIASFFGKAAINPHHDFFEMGCDSLKGMTLLARINKKMGVQLVIGDIYRFPTIKKLAQELVNRTATVQKNILPAPAKKNYALSAAQKRMYFLQNLYRDNIAYNETQLLEVSGNLDKEKFREIFQLLVQRHESLRTIFVYENGAPRQQVLEQVPFPIAYYKEEENNLEKIIRSFIQPFELSTGPLFRIGIVERAATNFVLMIDLHHIITDGVSKGILINDFVQLYEGKKLPAMRLQYKDFAEWQQAAEQQKEIAGQKEYWLQQFSDRPGPLVLPTDFARPAIKGYEGSSVEFTMGEALTKKMQSIAKQEGVSMFMLLVAAYNLFLNKLSGQDDIVIGIPTAGRQQHPDLENIIGMFTNTLVLRNDVKAEKTFRELLSTVKERTLAGFENQLYPYEELVNELQIERNPGNNPLFDVLFVYHGYEQAEMKIPGVTLKPYSDSYKVAKFDLTLEAVEAGEQIQLLVNYSTDLFRRSTIEKMVAWFKKIISTISINPDTAIADIEIITDNERRQVELMNNTMVNLPDTTVIAMIEQQVIKAPANTAITFDTGILNYKELWERSGKTAIYLRTVQKVKQGDLVGLLMEREENLIPSILGIMRAGAAYVPVDPAYPAERIQAIIKDAGLKVIITNNQQSTLIAATGVNLVNPADCMVEIKNITPLHLPLPAGNDLAYVIYTSGSTGKPKGVMIQHRSLLNYISWAAGQYIAGEKAVFPLFTSISFDLTVTSLFTPLITGNEIILYPETGKETNIEKIITDNKATIIKLTPSHLKMIRDLKIPTPAPEAPVKKFIVGGEEFEYDLAKDIFGLFNGRVEQYNEYGPTEATVGCMIYKFDPLRKLPSVPVGVPVANTKIYVLDKQLKPVPPGLKGEIYISGLGLAAGYYAAEQLTKEKFIPHPFIKGEKIYKTGDWATILDDGTILYGGRIDEQVKIRGYRVEIGEIEKHLSNHPLIKEAIVRTWKKKEEQQLVAYYVSEKEIDTSVLRGYLLEKLPAYMVPWQYMQLQKIPVTANGKTDRKLLPEPGIQKTAAYKAPSNETEQQLVKIWSAVLEIPAAEISITANFFELGGHSLKLIALNRTINEELNCSIPVVEMFRLPTITSIEKYIREADNGVQKIAGQVDTALQESNENLQLINELINH